ncbi:TPA: hypothetical protein ACN6Y1_003026 [Escherichia albertii]|nr:hypothetical protein [Escherichia coli]MDD8193420.1 hypothetical protein [Escherichia coli]
MAFDIFAGANVTVEVGTYTAGSTTPATDFEIIPELGAFPTMGASSVVVDVVTFNSVFNRKLLRHKIRRRYPTNRELSPGQSYS